MTETPERPESDTPLTELNLQQVIGEIRLRELAADAKERELDDLLTAFECACLASDSFEGRRTLRAEIRARLRASSLGEPVSQEAPHGARMIARDLKRLLDEEAEMFKPGRQHHNGPRRVVLDVEVHRGAQLVAFVEGFASRSAFSGIPRTENGPTSACECLDATHPEFCHSGPAHRGWCDMYAMTTDPARASVISSASPLSEAEREWIEGVRAEFAGFPGVVGRLLAIIDRLSASAPSPEDKGSDNAKE